MGMYCERLAEHTSLTLFCQSVEKLSILLNYVLIHIHIFIKTRIYLHTQPPRSLRS